MAEREGRTYAEMREWHGRNVTTDLDDKAKAKAAAEGKTFQGYVRRLVKEDVDGTRNGTRKVPQKMSKKVSQAKQAAEQLGPDDQRPNGHAVLTAETSKDQATGGQDFPESLVVGSGNGKGKGLPLQPRLETGVLIPSAFVTYLGSYEAASRESSQRELAPRRLFALLLGRILANRGRILLNFAFSASLC